MFSHSEFSWRAFSAAPSTGAAIVIAFSPMAGSFRKARRCSHDAYLVFAGSVLRRFRRRCGLALPGAARNPLVLVSDLACAGRGRGARIETDRRHPAQDATAGNSRAGEKFRSGRAAHLDAVVFVGRQDDREAEGSEPEP